MEIKLKKLFFTCFIFFSAFLYANELTDLLAYDEYNDGLYHYIPKSCVDVLYSKNRETIKKYYPDIEQSLLYIFIFLLSSIPYSLSFKTIKNSELYTTYSYNITSYSGFPHC